MRHIREERLIEYLLGSPASADSAGLESHLAECSQCADLKQEIQSFVRQLEGDAATEPPAELMQWAVELFQPIQQPALLAKSGRIRRLIASLVFDTFEQPLTAGVRSVGAPSRQLLFRAGDVDVDVKIESIETGNRISLVGQVLSPADKFFDRAPVKLESHGTVKFETFTNPVGEFSFEGVPKDTYHLSVDLPEGQITLFCVHRTNS